MASQYRPGFGYLRPPAPQRPKSRVPGQPRPPASRPPNPRQTTQFYGTGPYPGQPPTFAQPQNTGGQVGGRYRPGYGGGPEVAPPGYGGATGPLGPGMGAFPSNPRIINGPNGPIVGDPGPVGDWGPTGTDVPSDPLGPGMGASPSSGVVGGMNQQDPNAIYAFWTPERMAAALAPSMGAYDPLWSSYGGVATPGMLGGGFGGFNLSDLL